MPIEIRELVIRAVAIPEREDTEEGLEAEAGPRQPAESLDGQEAIIQECVRQVLRILRKEKER